jgi:hypothetical protein
LYWPLRSNTAPALLSWTAILRCIMVLMNAFGSSENYDLIFFMRGGWALQSHFGFGDIKISSPIYLGQRVAQKGLNCMKRVKTVTTRSECFGTFLRYLHTNRLVNVFARFMQIASWVFLDGSCRSNLFVRPFFLNKPEWLWRSSRSRKKCVGTTLNERRCGSLYNYFGERRSIVGEFFWFQVLLRIMRWC